MDATVEYLDEISLDTVWVHYKAEDGSDHKIVVNTALLEKHKNALKNLLVTYTRGEVRRDEEVLAIQSSARMKHPVHGQKVFMNMERKLGDRKTTRT